MDVVSNLLISGSPGVGKTSLSIALCRGVCITEPNAIPGRFEGWTVTHHPSEFDINVPLKRTSSNSSNNSSGSSGGNVNSPLSGKGFVSFTVWEDWPRKKPSAKSLDDLEDQPDDPDMLKPMEKIVESPFQEEKEQHHMDDKENNHVNDEPKQTKATISDTALTKHVLISSNSNPAGLKKVEEEEAELILPPCMPTRPCLSPRPDVIVLCFSAMNLDSLVEAETIIWPELTNRYPLVPIILVATQCDLKDRIPSTEEESTSVNSEKLDTVLRCDDNDKRLSRFGFVVTSEMGEAMAKRISASAYIECCSRDMKSVRPIVQEILKEKLKLSSHKIYI